MRDESELTSSRAEKLLSVETRQEDQGYLFVRVRGEVDLLTAPQLADAIPDGCSRCVADLSGVKFFGAAGLDALARAERSGVVLHVVCGPPVRRLLALTGSAEGIRVHDSLSEAESAARASC